MGSQARNNNEVWRILLLRRQASELLAVDSENGYTFPSAEVLEGCRVAPAVRDQLKTNWGLDTFVLCPLNPGRSCGHGSAARILAAEALDDLAPSPAGAQWIPFSARERLRFIKGDDQLAVRAFENDFAPSTTDADSFYVGCPGSFCRIRAWVDRAIEPFHLTLGSEFVQLNAGRNFSLIRFRTDRGGVWFKAVGEPNVHELPLSRELARIFPAFVPQILGVRENWNAWLTREVEGAHPGDDSPLESWISIAITLAELQIASIGATFAFIDAGCRDVRVPALVDAVRPYLQVAAALMREQEQPYPPPMNDQELEALESALFAALTHLESLDLPDTLSHLDFHPGNILVGGKGVVFLDWSAAGVGCPLITIEFLIERLRRVHPSLESWRNAVLSAYLERYRFLLRPRYLAAALATTPLVAAFAYAVASGAWSDPVRRRNPHTAAHLRSLTRRMNQEAQLLACSPGSRLVDRRVR